MIGHDCKNCSQSGNCEIQDTDNQAKEVMASGGVLGLSIWVIEAYPLSADQTYYRALAAVTLLADSEADLRILRKHMLLGAKVAPPEVPVLKNFDALMAVLAQGYTRALFEGAKDSAARVAGALGHGVAVTILQGASKKEAMDQGAEVKSCTLH